MPTPRPLAIALVTALVAGLASPAGIAAKKRPAPKKATVAPACTDFHADANRGWLAANPMPSSGAISALGQLTARAQQQQRDLLDAAMGAPQNNVQKLLGDFWASGLDEAAVERDGAAPVAPLLRRIDSIRKPKDIAPAIAALHQVGVMNVTLTSPAVDVVIEDSHAAYCTAISVIAGGLDV